MIVDCACTYLHKIYVLAAIFHHFSPIIQRVLKHGAYITHNTTIMEHRVLEMDP